ncbi:fimbrillin family protein [Dysgonomonas sp. 511]|uniref:fimbrillin family protein n=1 Tax=Dysgonomonas sp. 511 TaxID=2302930 RepID=UPI0013CF76E1|nr:fimbrillin family protein [Dysgonomonas sp. 511]NDV77916.1 hypothetical protein [Dysgonomonas sp. 511]
MKKLFLFAATIALMLASCSNDEDLGATYTGADGAIEFRTLTNKGAKAAITDETNILSFTVTGIKMTQGGTPAFDGYLFNAFGITRGEGDNWDYAPKRFWPADRTVDFYAYSPSSSKNVTSGEGLTDYDASSKKTIAYTVPDIALNNAQEDFLVARVTGQDKTTGPVKLNFHHALSRIMFFAKTTQTKVTYTIDKIELINLSKSGTLDLTNAGIKETGALDYTVTTPLVLWTATGSKGDYTADMSESPIKLASDDYKSVLGKTGAMLVLPQQTELATLTDDYTGPATDKFAIAVSYKAYDGDIVYANRTKFFAVKGSDAATGIAFEMGRQYNFYLGFGEDIEGEIDFQVGVSDWTTNVDIHPELDDYSSFIQNFKGNGNVTLYTDKAGASGDEYTLPTGKVTKADLAKVKYIKTTGTTLQFDGLEYFENLEKLWIENANASQDIDASKNAKLSEFYLYYTIKLGDVNLSNTALTLIKGGAPTVKNLNVSNTQLTQYCSSTAEEIELTGINVTGTLNMSNCGLSKGVTISSSGLAKLTPDTEINLSGNELTTFEIPTGVNIKKLDLSNNRLTTLTVPASGSSFTIESLNLSNNLFKTLNFNDCKIAGTLDVSNNSKLTDLTFTATGSTGSPLYINIANVNAAGNTLLQKVKFVDGKYNCILLKELDIRDSKNFTLVDARHGIIEKLTVWPGCTWNDVKDRLNVAGGNGQGEIKAVYAAGSSTSLGKKPQP